MPSANLSAETSAEEFVPANWTAVGDAITERLDELDMQQRELAALSNVSVATIRELQRGKVRRRNPRILRDISLGLGWPANHLQTKLQDGQPSRQPLGTEAEASAGDPTAFFSRLAFVLEHQFGHVVDVIYNDGSNVDIRIEIRHSSRA
jgi:transcriptional regulator with XRE-family HTH domain